jgi:hypothetical protein
MPRKLALVAWAALTAGLPACNTYESRLPETGATLEGTIKLGAEAVPMALVVVVGPNGSATGQIEEGRYKVENVPLGDVKIGVNTEAVRGQLISLQMARSNKGPSGKGGGGPPLPKFIEVPKKYAEPETSGVTTHVKAGTNQFDIVLGK